MPDNPYRSPEVEGTRRTQYGWFWRVPLAIGLLIDAGAALLLILLVSGAMYSPGEAFAAAGRATLLSIPFLGIALLMRLADSR